MLEKVFMIVTGGEFIIGILGNGFIGLTNCITWIRNQKLCLVDLIHTSLAFARISELCITTISLFSVLLYQKVPDATKGNRILTGSWILANHLSTWFATGLAVFYFLKIANFSYPLFLWLKWRINKVMFMLLLFSVPFLLMKENYLAKFPLSFSLDVFQYHVQNKHERNMTRLFNVSKNNDLNYVMLCITWTLTPFSLSLMSFVLLLLSLWRHTQHSELSIKDSRDPRMEAHFRAMKTVLFFLVLFALYQFAFFMMFLGYFSLHNKLVVMFGYVIGIIYPSGHSYVVIWGNSQMRKAFLRILWPLKCALKGKALSAA